MKLFFKEIGKFLIGSIPILLLLLAGYFYYDPFKVLYKYNNYSYYKGSVNLNRDYISTEVFTNNYVKHKYNSFILGSSRAHQYRPSSWRKYLPPGSSPFSFDAGAESLYGMYTKLRYIDSLNVKIDNALILLDRDWSFSNYENQSGPLFIKAPAVSGESRFTFHIKFIGYYFDPAFLRSYYVYKYTHQYKSWMHSVLLPATILFNDTTNEVTIESIETEARENPAKYYGAKKDIFYERKGESIDGVDRIDKNFMPLLLGIKQILQKHNTDYRIVLNPLYEQIKFSPNDRKILENLFGGHIYDFAGKNKFTDSITSYYETSHFRPHVGDSVMKIVYQK